LYLLFADLPQKAIGSDRLRETVLWMISKLGQFYLGKKHTPATGRFEESLVMFDSKDLTTHGVCVGMTGSGKTGLCLSILEEAAIDSIPAIVIDQRRYGKSAADVSNLSAANQPE
jgi:hypothetical protein